MTKAQREYYLRQQLKAIQKELGEIDEEESVRVEYEEKLKKANLPEEAPEGGPAGAEAPRRDAPPGGGIYGHQDLP